MLSSGPGTWPSSVWWQAAAVTVWVKVQLTGLERASCNQSCLCACVWKAWSLVSAFSCLLQWFCVCPPFSPPTQVTSSPSAKEAEQGEGALVFSSNAKTAAAADRSSGVVTTDVTPAIGDQWRRMHCSHTYTLVAFSMSSYIYFNVYLGQGSSWPRAEVAAKKKNEVRGCWDEIGAPTVKIKELWAVRFLILSWVWKSISNTVCTGFQGYFAQVPCISILSGFYLPLYICSVQARDVNVTWRKLTVDVCAFIRFTSFRPQHSSSGKLN